MWRRRDHSAAKSWIIAHRPASFRAVRLASARRFSISLPRQRASSTASQADAEPRLMELPWTSSIYNHLAARTAGH